MDSILIKNGRIIDPANKRDGVFDILVEGSKISKVKKSISAKAKKIIDAKGKIVTPGLIDIHVHLREPGREDIETIASGTHAAISGGITSVCSMPNTRPPIDNYENLKCLKDIIKKDAQANVFIVGAITKGREGKEIVDMKNMKKGGVVALSDDGNSVQDELVMFDALKKAKENNLLLISHCEDKNISRNGVVNEGIVATKLGLRGIPKRAEYEFIKRDLTLAKKAKARIHIAHVSCKESVDIIRKAKKDGVSVSAETAPHYFSLTDSCCVTYDTRTKMNPPLRSKEDVEAIKEGLRDGTIDAIASDHAPHGKHEKEIVFEQAAFGIIGLETLLPIAMAELIHSKLLTWPELVKKVSLNPSRILGLNRGTLTEGKVADITIIDPDKEWTYKKENIKSKSKNSPFIDWKFKGLAIDVIVGGKLVLKK
ncbi:MAG: dihydroorotase [Candidatus Omnitrophica bacterium]|nr:dihydroorotase [Candidatus Omnitrophota bacterium]